ncbi:MAG: STAS domain-containing protein [Pseudomonadota bacterium]
MRATIAEGDEEGTFSIEGPLTFDSVGALLDRATKLFEPHSRIVVDLSGITDSDSAGLALLIEWVTWANHSVREMIYENTPEKLLNIAAISEVEGLLEAGERWKGFL